MLFPPGGATGSSVFQSISQVATRSDSETVSSSLPLTQLKFFLNSFYEVTIDMHKYT